MDSSPLSQLASYDKVATVKILDTTDLALHEVAQRLADWINHTENTDYNLPIPNTSYRLELNLQNAYDTIDQKLFEFNKSCVIVFFVEENYRHQGLGTILLNNVEEKAKQLGATLSHPKGHKRYYMKKTL